jgi:hypothetical protein
MPTKSPKEREMRGLDGSNPPRSASQAFLKLPQPMPAQGRNERRRQRDAAAGPTGRR